jgi:hypothetical protein
MPGATPLPAIEGVSDQLIWMLNDRFRQLGTQIAAPAAAPPAVVAPPPTIIQQPSTTTISFYGTHAARATKTASATPGALYFESDRGNVGYSSQGSAWIYVSGEYVDVLANRPADLGTNDKGFRFLASDTWQRFQWSGTAWGVQIQPGAPELQAFASGSLTLTTTAADIPNCTLTLPYAGVYLVTGIFSFNCIGADTGIVMRGQLVVGGGLLPQQAFVAFATTGSRACSSNQWLARPNSANQIAKLQGLKDTGGTGSSNITASATSISAIWLHP